MKKVMTLSISMLLVLGLVTGCGCNKKEEKEKTNTNTPSGEETVIKDQIYEGLEFVNVGATNGVVKTTVINNTGVVYEGSKFSMKIMDSNGNVLKEATDEVKGPMETGTTKTVETKVGIDLSKAASIEYSIVK